MSLKNISGKLATVKWDGKNYEIPAGKTIRFVNEPGVEVHMAQKYPGLFEHHLEPPKPTKPVMEFIDEPRGVPASSAVPAAPGEPTAAAPAAPEAPAVGESACDVCGWVGKSDKAVKAHKAGKHGS